MRRQPLPRDVLAVIQLASGGREKVATAAAATSRHPDYVVAAAELYLRQVVCFPGANPFRTLGVAVHAPRSQVRQHMRELVLWLHPDRQQGGRDAALMQRILEAWRIVGGSESHASDLPGAASAAAVAPHPERRRRTAPYRPTWIAQPMPKTRRGRRARRRSAMTLRALIVFMALVVPEAAFLSPPNPADSRKASMVAPSAVVAASPLPLGPSPHPRTDLK